MSQSFIRVGGSRALTIPAKAIRESGYDDKTQFEFDFAPNGFMFKAKKRLPVKEKRRAMSPMMKELLSNPVIYSKKEIDEDERLKALLEG